MTAGAVRRIAVVNMKGGVGKTSTVVSLADALGTATETAVLVLDVDTQANASYCLVGDRIREIIGSGRTIDTFLRLSLLEGETPPFGDHITRMVSNTKARSRAAEDRLLASSTDLRVSEREISRHLTNAGETLDGVEVRIKNTLQHQSGVARRRVRVCPYRLRAGHIALYRGGDRARRPGNRADDPRFSVEPRARILSRHHRP